MVTNGNYSIPEATTPDSIILRSQMNYEFYVF